MKDLCLIKNAEVNTYPFSVKDRVKIKWAAPNNVIDTGTITKLHTSIQWKKHIVHAIMVLVDGKEKHQVVCPNILQKIKENEAVQKNIEF